MKNTKHTPTELESVLDDDGTLYFRESYNDKPSSPFVEYNATLIAAAPELLEVAQLLLSEFAIATKSGRSPNQNYIYTKAIDAIRKAKGEV